MTAAEPRVTAVVPTLGLSPWLGECLEALRRDGGEELEIVVVDQGREAAELPPGLADHLLRTPANEGFAAANNRGFAAARGRYLATVNDDALVEAGWFRRLLETLEASPEVAAVQGVVLRLEAPAEVDGCGLAWNRWWQAVQVGRGGAPPPRDAPPREVFGVSATAALFRREALEAVAGPAAEAGLEVFERRLVSYYEDVDLAGRLRRAGGRALVVPAARARHAGSASGARLPLAGREWIYGNRYLVLARLLGRGFWPRLPKIWLRDAADLWNALRASDTLLARGVLAGWRRAAGHLHRFAHRGPPALAPAEILRLGPDV